YSRRQRRSGKIPEEFQGQAEAQFPPAWRSHPQNDRILRRLAHEEIHGPFLQGYRPQHFSGWPHRQNRADLGRSQSQRPRRRNSFPPHQRLNRCHPHRGRAPYARRSGGIGARSFPIAFLSFSSPSSLCPLRTLRNPSSVVAESRVSVSSGFQLLTFNFQPLLPLTTPSAIPPPP